MAIPLRADSRADVRGAMPQPTHEVFLGQLPLRDPVPVAEGNVSTATGFSWQTISKLLVDFHK